MKKSYTKQLVYCENHKTGVVVSNSEEYEQKMKQKMAEMEVATEHQSECHTNEEKCV